LMHFALTAIFTPLSDRHAGIIENMRDGCQAPPFAPWGACVELVGGGAAGTPPPTGNTEHPQN